MIGGVEVVSHKSIRFSDVLRNVVASHTAHQLVFHVAVRANATLVEDNLGYSFLILVVERSSNSYDIRRKFRGNYCIGWLIRAIVCVLPSS